MAQIKGINKVLKNLRKELKKATKGSEKGMIRLGLEIKGISMRNVPIDFGNLRASHYVAWKGNVDSRPVWKKGGSQTDLVKLSTNHTRIVGEAVSTLDDGDVQIGVSAHYAAIQHENLSFSHTVGGPKFLQNAIDNVTPRALKIIAQDANIKGG